MHARRRHPVNRRSPVAITSRRRRGSVYGWLHGAGGALVVEAPAARRPTPLPLRGGWLAQLRVSDARRAPHRGGHLLEAQHRERGVVDDFGFGGGTAPEFFVGEQRPVGLHGRSPPEAVEVGLFSGRGAAPRWSHVVDLRRRRASRRSSVVGPSPSSAITTSMRRILTVVDVAPVLAPHGRRSSPSGRCCRSAPLPSASAKLDFRPVAPGDDSVSDGCGSRFSYERGPMPRNPATVIRLRNAPMRFRSRRRPARAEAGR